MWTVIWGIGIAGALVSAGIAFHDWIKKRATERSTGNTNPGTPREETRLEKFQKDSLPALLWGTAGLLFLLFLGWYFWGNRALEFYLNTTFLSGLFCFIVIVTLWKKGGWAQLFALASIILICVHLIAESSGRISAWIDSFSTQAKAGEAIPPKPASAPDQLNELKRKTMSLFRSDYARPSNVNEFIWPADPKRECGFIQGLTPPHRSHMRRVYVEIQGTWPLCATGRMEGVVVEAVGMASKGCVTISYQEHNDPPEKNRLHHVCAGQEWSPRNVSWYRFVNGDRNNNIVIYFDYDKKS